MSTFRKQNQVFNLLGFGVAWMGGVQDMHWVIRVLSVGFEFAHDLLWPAILTLSLEGTSVPKAFREAATATSVIDG